MEFFGRERELSELDSIRSEGGCAVMVYGRRRIGKTALLEKFCEGKRSLFLRCLKDSEDSNCGYFSRTISDFLGREVSIGTYRELVPVLETVCTMNAIIVIDEYPYIASPSVSSLLQHFVDGPLANSGSMLILCGSSVAVMKEEASDSGNPLYGRFRKSLEIGELPFADCRKLVPGMDDIDALKLYLTVGGIPKYFRDMGCGSFRESIVKNFLSGENIVTEVEQMVYSELPHPRRALAILSAIGRGSTSLKEISEKVKTDETLCQKCIKAMMNIGLVSKLSPMFDAPKRPVYYISDGIAAFRFYVIRWAGGHLTPEHAEEAYSLMENDISAFLGKRFEAYCEGLIGRSFLILESGTWWMDRDDEHEEIDIVSRIASGKVKYDLFCECKFTNGPMDRRDLAALRRRAGRFDGNCLLVLFSVSGFDDELQEAAEGQNILLAGPEVIFGTAPFPKLPRPSD